MGGDADEPIFDFILELARSKRPKLLWVGTATAEEAERTLRVYERFRGRAEVSHLRFFPWPPDDLRGFTLEHDVILVGGGNTANMLALWRLHGFDQVVREAWEQGTVLCGGSAGMICWYEAGVTDSFGPQLAGMRDGLGFLAGSACPHWNDEELRRPTYHRLIAEEGFPPGVAVESGVGLHYVGTELVEAVSDGPDGQAFRVDLDPNGNLVETALEVRQL
jgi:peptidase E